MNQKHLIAVTAANLKHPGQGRQPPLHPQSRHKYRHRHRGHQDRLVTDDLLVTALHLAKAESEDTNYTKYVSKINITEDEDYLENIAYVGTLSNGKNIIIILPNALCTEAFEIETKNAEQTTFSVKFECTADLENDTLNKLDIELYYPTATV